MKHVFRFFLVLGIAVLSVLGCSSPFEQSSGGGYRVRIPVNDGHGQYHLATVTLKSVTNISSLSGSVVNIRMNGQIANTLTPDGRQGKWVKNLGTVPAAHFVKSGDVLIPADYKTLIMASVIYQFENIKDFYDEYKGNEGLLFPRTVLLDMNEPPESGSGDFAHNDAEYIPGLDMFVVEPYDQGQIPLSINGGILAHEYFQSILANREIEKEKKVKSFEMKTDSKEILCANELQLQGLNEGIADFFGYAYTHDPDYGSISFPGDNGRDLSVFKNMDSDGGSCRDNNKNVYHGIGVRVAHMLYVISQDWGIEETSRNIFNFLNLYLSLFTTDHDKSFIGYRKILPILFADHRPSDDLCEKIQRIMAIPGVFSSYCKAPTKQDLNL